jgi:uncharacterized RDD family membrane protein YckC
VAGIGPRLGAWLIDWLIFLVVGVGFGLAGLVAGSMAENPEAARQLLADPTAQPSVPLLIIRLDEVIALAATWVAAVVVYSAVCWTSFRGLPGQRLRSLEVADAQSGANLSPFRALLRSLALNGLPAAALAVMVVASVDMMATVPASTYAGDSSELSQLVMTGRWGGMLSIASMTLWLWLPALLVSAAASFRRRGLHDRLGRSVVVRAARLPYGWPGIAGSAPQNGGWAPGRPPAGAPGASPDGSPRAPQTGGPYPPTAPPPPPADGGVRRGWFPADESEPVAGRLGGVLRTATLGRRVAAYLLDGLLMYGVYQLAFMLVVDPAAGDDALILNRDLVIIMLGAGATQCAYFVATWSLIRGSLGQRSVGLLVVRESGDRLGVLDGVARWAVLQGPLALLIALPAGVIGPIVIAVWAALLMSSVRMDAQGRGYHDRIAGSRVILQG